LTPAIRRSVRANGIEQSWLEYGSAAGPKLIIIPGITSPAITWDATSRRLAGTFHVLALDVRGRGESGHPQTGYTLADYSADVAGIIEQLGIGAPAILGHSMGARIAVAFAHEHPGLRGPVVVVDPPLTGPGRAPLPLPLSFYLDRIRAARQARGVADMERFYPGWAPELVQRQMAALASCSEAAIIETYTGFHDEDFYERWRHVAPPVLFVRGADSPMVKIDMVDELRNANPGAQMHTVPGAGHMVQWDNEDDFVAACTGFVLSQRHA
jgi:N-formylmaleamate deformylase